jgi:hypothetical protein
VTDKRLVDNLNGLIKHPPKPRERLQPVGSPGTLPGRGTGKPGDTAGTGSGIASPLTEQPAKTIEVVKTIAITGGDGEVDLAQMTDVTFLDADGREVRMILKPDDRPLPVPPAVP